MDQIEARDVARSLNTAGFEVIADNRGGWSGQPGSMIWGVRPMRHDGQTGNYESVAEMPQVWQDVLTGRADPDHNPDEVITGGLEKASAGEALEQINDWLVRHYRLAAHFAVNDTDDGLTVTLVASNGAEYGEIRIPLRVAS